MKRLVSVDAPHFCAGMIAENGIVIEAAPILKWAVGKDSRWLAGYFRRKGWRWQIVEEFE